MPLNLDRVDDALPRHALGAGIAGVSGVGASANQ